MTDAWLGAVEAPAVGPADLALLDRDIPDHRIVRMCRSSGTTGSPQLVAMLHATQQRNVAGFARTMLAGLESPANFLCLYNLTLRSAYYRVLATLQRGGTLRFADATEAAGLIESGAVNMALFMVGDMQRILRHARPPPAGQTMHVEAVGAAVGARLRRQVRELLGATFTNAYSSIETGRIALLGDDNVGALCPGVEACIVDQGGRAQPPGTTGLIQVRTPTMVEGYHNDFAMTGRYFVDGWFRTNDLGTMPAPARLIVLGRADDRVNAGGVKLLPAPIEAQIKLIEGVVEAALVAVNGPGQSPTLLVAVETANGAPPPNLKAQLDPIRWPYVRSFAVLITPRFPRTDRGKVRRKDVAAIYAQVRANPDRVIRSRAT